MMEEDNKISDKEIWLYKNREALSSVKRGLEQKGKHRLSDMPEYLEENE